MTPTRTAWHIPRYGRPETLTPVTLPMPQPGPTEVLIRIHASAVTRADGMMRKGEPLFARPFLGLRRPLNGLAGTGLSGEVIAVGGKVRRFVPGEMVFGEAGMRFGANASHICLDEEGVLMPKPAALPHEDAAVLCDGVLTSWHFLRNLGEVQRGDRVRILSELTGIASVLEAALYVDDLDAAEGFYGDLLGLERIVRVEGRHVLFRCGATVVLAFVAEATEQPPGPGALPIPPHGARGPGHICFAVPGGGGRRASEGRRSRSHRRHRR